MASPLPRSGLLGAPLRSAPAAALVQRSQLAWQRAGRACRGRLGRGADHRNNPTVMPDCLFSDTRVTATAPHRPALRLGVLRPPPRCPPPSAQASSALRPGVLRPPPRCPLPSAQVFSALRPGVLRPPPRCPPPSAQASSALRPGVLRPPPRCPPPSAQVSSALRPGVLRPPPRCPPPSA